MQAETTPPDAGQQQPRRRNGTRRALLVLLGPALLLTVGVVLIVLVGVAQRVGWIAAGGGGAAPAATQDATYTCPMDPQIRQPTPGRCPICGMELVVAAAAGSLDEFAVKIDPAARRVAGIETEPAAPIALTRTVRAVGAIDYDESQLKTIAAYVAGRVETLFGDYTGVTVEQGKEMVRLFSPELYAAQNELLQTKQMLERAQRDGLDRLLDSQRQLYRAARRKLLELGMTETQIAEVEQRGEAETRITISAPTEGTVIEKLAVEGQYVKAGEPIYRIADLRVVWLLLELFPEDAAQIRYGQRVAAQVQSLPGETFDGRVAFVDPMVDQKTRTVGVRVVVPNDAGKLRPGEYATAKIEVAIGARGEVYESELAGKWISPRHPQIITDGPGRCPICNIELVSTDTLGYAGEPVEQRAALVVPRGAVLKVGAESVVYVETEPGRFEIRTVRLGSITDQWAVVLEGLDEGDEVATAGNFLIDSQMQLEGKPSLIDPSKAVAKAKQDAQKRPMDLGKFTVVPHGGSTGAALEQLYQAYFQVQQALAADANVEPPHAETVRAAAESLLAEAVLQQAQLAWVETIRDHADALAAPSINESRQAFKPVSHAVLRLASHARGEGAEQSFVHFFCPMVKGGGGDWMQPAPPLVNPYWGSKMLHCGKQVTELPATGEQP